MIDFGAGLASTEGHPTGPARWHGDRDGWGVVRFIVLKRSNPQLLESYGHWWLELDGEESYGWWPDRCPLRFKDLFVGTQTGRLNGVGGSCRGGSPTTDPNHGEPADHEFHPRLAGPKDG